MDLSTAQQILVVVLATALAIFLVLSIFAMILVIRLIQTLRAVADKAEHLVESAEAVGNVFKQVAGPVTVLRFFKGLANFVSHHNNNDKKE